MTKEFKVTYTFKGKVKEMYCECETAEIAVKILYANTIGRDLIKNIVITEENN